MFLSSCILRALQELKRDLDKLLTEWKPKTFYHGNAKGIDPVRVRSRPYLLVILMWAVSSLTTSNKSTAYSLRLLQPLFLSPPTGLVHRLYVMMILSTLILSFWGMDVGQ